MTCFYFTGFFGILNNDKQLYCYPIRYLINSLFSLVLFNGTLIYEPFIYCLVYKSNMK